MAFSFGGNLTSKKTVFIFIAIQRLKRALKILENSRAKVNEIAYSVSFNTPSYFIKCFKQVYNKMLLKFSQSIHNQ
tara:strand:+ start:69 stop:296 length:228 start_codon:yes stop_codon:yes gene_type:complete